MPLLDAWLRPVAKTARAVGTQVARRVVARATEAATEAAREAMAREAGPLVRQALVGLGRLADVLEAPARTPKTYDDLPPETRAIIDAHRRRY